MSQTEHSSVARVRDAFAAAGIDPVAFRLAHITDERERAVIEAVAKAAVWKPGEKGDGRRGRGVAYARYKTVATYAAVIAEVEVNRATGSVRVPRIWIAADAGQIINPDGLTNQIEGGVIQSTSWTLHEHVQFDRNGILSQDWSNYPVLTMRDVPRVETVLIDRPDERALGAGEAAQGPTAAAIANAFAAASHTHDYSSSTVYFDQVIAQNNGNGTNYRVGDDAWIGDVNVSNTMRFAGQQDSTQAYIIFGSSNGLTLGRSGTGALTYQGAFTAQGGIQNTPIGNATANTGTFTTVTAATVYPAVRRPTDMSTVVLANDVFAQRALLGR